MQTSCLVIAKTQLIKTKLDKHFWHCVTKCVNLIGAIILRCGLGMNITSRLYSIDVNITYVTTYVIITGRLYL